MQAPRAEGVSAPPQRDQATDCVALAATAFVALAAGKLRWPAKTDVARRRAWLLFWLALYAARAVVAGGVWRRAALLLLLLLVARNKQDGVLPSLHPVLVVATQDELPPGGGDDQVSAGLQRDGRGLEQWKRPLDEQFSVVFLSGAPLNPVRAQYNVALLPVLEWAPPRDALLDEPVADEGVIRRLLHASAFDEPVRIGRRLLFARTPSPANTAVINSQRRRERRFPAVAWQPLFLLRSCALGKPKRTLRRRAV